MKKLILAAIVLVTLAASPAMATVSHWTCSSDTTVMYLVIESKEFNYDLFSDAGKQLAHAKFSKEHTDTGVEYLFSALDNGVALALVLKGDKLILGMTKDKDPVTQFECI